MINFVHFSSKNHLSSLLFRVRIKSHFPLKIPITYFHQVTVQIVCCWELLNDEEQRGVIRSYHPRCHPVIQGYTYIFEGLSWKVILSQPYVGWIRIKTHSLTNFPSPKGNIFLTVTENKFIVWNYSSSGSTGIYFIEFNNNDSRIKWEVCSKLTITAPDVVLVSLLLTLIIFDTFF